jgi:hypothetical protein
VVLRPSKPVAPKKPASQSPLDDVEAAALDLVETMPSVSETRLPGAPLLDNRPKR